MDRVELTLPERDWRDIFLLLADVHGIMRGVAVQHGDFKDIGARTPPALEQLRTAADALAQGIAQSSLADSQQAWVLGEPYGENSTPLTPVTVGFEPVRAQHLLQRLDHIGQAQHITFTGGVYGDETIGRLKAVSVHAERLHGALRAALVAAGLPPQDVPPGGRFVPEDPSQLLALTQPERAWRDLYKVLTQIHGAAKAVGDFLPELGAQMADVNHTLDAAAESYFDALDGARIDLRRIETVWQPMQPLGWAAVPDRPLELTLPRREAQQLRRLLAWGGRLAELPYRAKIGPHVMGLLHGYGRDAQQVLATFSATLAATGTPLDPLPSNLAAAPFHRPN